jgi:S-DNA-T family DNA segregation ATPase FtsK/SpoIIIE
MVASAIDSRTILDESGAEKLLGNGDMLYKMGNMKMPLRVQGAYITMKEVKAVVTYIKENNESYFDEEVSNYINSVKENEEDNISDEDYKVEDVYIEALKTVIQAGQASISMIQRKYSVGYNKAGKIIDWMENMGYISAFEGSKSRQVLISIDSFEEKYGKI